jgi:glycerol-3-phosphate dehydrogenase
MGLTVYDLLALRWNHDFYSPHDFQLLAPHISQSGLEGGFRYGDAQTDDARLTLRVIQEAVAEGATAINYVKANRLISDETKVVGVELVDLITNQKANAYARVVINATGAWADILRKQAGGPPRIRPLRGSHLIFPNWRLPVAQAVSFLHPLDHRPVFIFPWESVTLVGTTDVDHSTSLDQEPKITPEEVAYLMAAVEYQFPSLAIHLEDILSTYAGVRPVIGCGKLKPSDESREHIIWEENGLLTVTGGKLTTFRLIGLDVLNSIQRYFPEMKEPDAHMPVLNQIDEQIPECKSLSENCRRRLLGRFGSEAFLLVDSAQSGEMEAIPGTNFLWAELRWAARSEGVCHLEDLLMRRTRLALILPNGAESIIPKVKSICMDELGWSENRWKNELKNYQQLWKECYSLPSRESIPDRKQQVQEAIKRQQVYLLNRRRRFLRHSTLAGLLFILIASLVAYLTWRHGKQYGKQAF